MRARPSATVTCGAPSARRRTITSGLAVGGDVGSAASATTVPSRSTKRRRTLPRVTSTAPVGRQPVRATTGGSPPSANRSGMGSTEAAPLHGSASAPSAAA